MFSKGTGEAFAVTITVLSGNCCAIVHGRTEKSVAKIISAIFLKNIQLMITRLTNQNSLISF